MKEVFFAVVPPPVANAPTLTTNKKDALADAPARLSGTSAKINGTLTNIFGATPTETGVVYREITGTDYSSLPFLDALGTSVVATPPTYNVKTPAIVTTAGGKITLDINLISTTSNKRPYYFRTYAKSPLGIGYGDPVIFNVAPPVISTPVVTNTAPLAPVFAGTLTLNAGTPSKVTEYGYCSSTTNNPPTTADAKVVLSTADAITALNTKLNSDSFAADPTVDLATDIYDVKLIVPNYFVYYVTIDGVTTYSPVATFTPVADPITGGVGLATYVDSSIFSFKPLKITEISTTKFLANFKVTKAGSYSFTTTKEGNTTGIDITSPLTGSFTAAEVGTTKTIEFLINGTPYTSTDGNTFTISGITTPFDTGKILDMDPTGKAICDGTKPTTVVPVTITLADGIKQTWMDRNLGASRQATSSTDFYAFGCFFQWGRGNDGGASVDWTSATTMSFVNGISTMNVRVNSDTPGNQFIPFNSPPYNWHSPANAALWQGVSGTNNPCPTGYRIPTFAETKKIFSVTIHNTAEAFASPLKFPFPSYFNGNSQYQPNSATYMPNSDAVGDMNGDYYFNSTDSDSNSEGISSVQGLAVRCIKN